MTASAAGMAELLADYGRRLASLERATQLGRSSIADGAGNDLALVDVVTQTAATAAAALEAATSAQATADGKVTVFYETGAPTVDDVASLGDMWVDVTNPDAPVAYQYDGAVWAVMANGDAAAALAAAQDAQATADGKIESFWQPDPPTGASYGDLWFDTNDGNHSYRWDGTAWQSLAIGTGAILPGAVVPEVMGSGNLGATFVVDAGALQSASYVEGEDGWRFSDEDSQVESLNVLGEMGADSVTARAVTVGGDDLVADLLNPLPLGLIAIGANASGTNTGDIGATEKTLFTFNTGSLFGARYYKIIVHGHLQGTTPGDAFDLGLRYTVNGSTPGPANDYLAGSLTRVTLPTATPSTAFQMTVYYTPSGDYDSVRFALTAWRAAGTGTALVYLNDPARALQFAVEDLGLQSNVGGTLSQISKASTTSGGTTTTPPPDPDPPATYTKSWSATWGRSYDGDNGTRAGDDGPDLYQGYYSGTHGNTRSLFGFDYAGIQRALAGATVKSIKLTYRVRHTYPNAGSTIYVSSHNYASKPSTWAEANVVHDRVHRGSCTAGSTYTVTLPVAVGNEFKSGTTRGLGFGNAPSNAQSLFAYMYGVGSGSPPKLTITYTK